MRRGKETERVVMGVYTNIYIRIDMYVCMFARLYLYCVLMTKEAFANVTQPILSEWDIICAHLFIEDLARLTGDTNCCYKKERESRRAISRHNLLIQFRKYMGYGIQHDVYFAIDDEIHYGFDCQTISPGNN